MQPRASHLVPARCYERCAVPPQGDRIAEEREPRHVDGRAALLSARAPQDLARQQAGEQERKVEPHALQASIADVLQHALQSLLG